MADEDQPLYRMRVRSPWLLHALGISITLVTFVFDLMMPLGVAAAVPYVLLVLLSLQDPRRDLTWFAAVSGTVLAFLGFYWSPQGSELWKVLTNRSLAIFVIWVTAYLVLQQKTRAAEFEKERMARLHSEKLASLGEVAAGIAHELGNPLAAIQGRIELLERKLGPETTPSDDVRGFLKIQMDLSERMVRIIRGMTSLSRDASSDDFQTARTAPLVRGVIALSREKLRHLDIELRQGPLDDQLSLLCSEVQIAQVLSNLIGNAIDAVRDLSERWIQIEVHETPEAVEISVTDSGSGIPESIRGKIMEPFFTTKDVGKGTGLGLSISRRIVDRHSGRLEIDTKCPNTRLLVTLPKR